VGRELATGFLSKVGVGPEIVIDESLVARIVPTETAWHYQLGGHAEKKWSTEHLFEHG
jgi:hypothetical protein